MQMTPAQQDLSRKLSQHPRFEWRRGMSMLRYAPGKADNGKLDHIVVSAEFVDSFWEDAIPDLADPATVGALAGLARDMTTSYYCCLYIIGEGWCIADTENLCPRTPRKGATEGEAWAALILSLP